MPVGMSPSRAASNLQNRMKSDRNLARELNRRVPARALLLLAGLSLCAGVGCSSTRPGSAVVFYCDGAGWYTGGPRVKSGLEDHGFDGAFETFSWSTLLGPGTDHLIAARSQGLAKRLAKRIEKYHEEYPQAKIYMMGLSAGTSVVLGALEHLPKNFRIDNVVLLSPSVSASRDLVPAMRHVGGCLYSTSSRKDAILGPMVVNADGGDGPPAGLRGFRRPRRRRTDTTRSYARVVNLPWQPAYLAYDWDGGHTSVTNPKFIKSVIAPRLFCGGMFPLDRPMMVMADGVGAE